MTNAVPYYEQNYFYHRDGSVVEEYRKRKIHDVSENIQKPSTVLDDAKKLVYGDRENDYGTPRQNMAVIAGLWNAYLDAKVTAPGWRAEDPFIDADDVAVLMMLLKIGRVATGSSTRDTVADIAGYAAVLARTIGLDE